MTARLAGTRVSATALVLLKETGLLEAMGRGGIAGRALAENMLSKTGERR